MNHDWIMARVGEMKALGETTPRPARDVVRTHPLGAPGVPPVVPGGGLRVDSGTTGP